MANSKFVGKHNKNGELKSCAKQGGFIGIGTTDATIDNNVRLSNVTMHGGGSEVGGAILIRHTVDTALNIELTDVRFDGNNAVQLAGSSDIGLFQNYENKLQLALHNVSKTIKAVSWPHIIQFDLFSNAKATTHLTSTYPNRLIVGVVQAIDIFQQQYLPMKYCDVDGVCSFVSLELHCVTSYSSESCPVSQQILSPYFASALGNISFVVVPGNLNENVTISLACSSMLSGSVCPMNQSLKSSSFAFSKCPTHLEAQDYNGDKNWFECDDIVIPNFDFSRKLFEKPLILAGIIVFILGLLLLTALALLHDLQKLNCNYFVHHPVEYSNVLYSHLYYIHIYIYIYIYMYIFADLFTGNLCEYNQRSSIPCFFKKKECTLLYWFDGNT
ncbi:hypothetical protein RFI_26151 [Reticulomyxa filosa]|uniref:Uncharacterized protein n=1 Tax=Reticulomyxa filosa TaxID=46433 RepID=X6MDV7_RETFI|nr:hypothetical protein RFI_26151 [Reticulomyxa filosa]|eukprot:ETO11225.1 hypothetical protein RFI_26151 [Reticulomyxa filosa]